MDCSKRSKRMDIMPAPKGHKPYRGSETGGRPKTYTPEFIEQEAKEFEKWMEFPENLYFKKFALSRGYHPNRLTEWAKENEKFACVYEKAQAWQEIRLVEGGLTSEFNSGFCKFVMGNTCGWFDKQETKLIGDTANPLQFLLEKADGSSKELVVERK